MSAARPTRRATFRGDELEAQDALMWALRAPPDRRNPAPSIVVRIGLLPRPWRLKRV
jgi:hypothetical protein